ncbi:hypothetical protein VT84_17900 [Gemmata sp. SH-PL17]|nr:hypothetical protein VT84_17900 [Gemmata sp. SH-PL17]
MIDKHLYIDNNLSKLIIASSSPATLALARKKN